MELKYDAIFGLTYKSSELYYIIDLACIPDDITVGDFIEQYEKFKHFEGLELTPAIETYLPIYSNY